MVKRFVSQRKHVYKDAPWWDKNRKFTLNVVLGITMVGLFGSMILDFFNPHRSRMVAEFNPRTDDDVRQLRKRLDRREKELTDSPYGKF